MNPSNDSEHLKSMILIIRGRRVMLDSDLAALYGVETRALNQAVRRNATRFPPDFLFELTREEILNISQSVICSASHSNLKHAKRVAVFTQNGVAMLSGVLKSPRAIQTNIEIMRAFTHLRGALAIHRVVLRKLAALERKFHGHDDQLAILAEAIQQLEGIADDAPKSIGFKP